MHSNGLLYRQMLLIRFFEEKGIEFFQIRDYFMAPPTQLLGRKLMQLAFCHVYPK